MSEEEIKKQKEEKEKHNALLAGVIFFMVLIVMLWLANTANILTNSFKSARRNADLDKFTQELQTTFDEAKIKINNLKQISPEELEKAKNDLQSFYSTTTGAAKSIEK
jgi:hypothetical protein